jgi:hypothetical protein
MRILTSYDGTPVFRWIDNDRIEVCWDGKVLERVALLTFENGKWELESDAGTAVQETLGGTCSR